MGTEEGLGYKRVTVKLRDGNEYSHEVAIAKGTPRNPLTPEEFNAKYRDCASEILNKEDTEKSLSMLSELSKLKNMRELTEVVAKKIS